VVTLFGLTLASEKRIDFGRVDGKEARRLFIADALAADHAGFGADEPEFLTANRQLRRTVLDAEARLRKRDLYVGEAGVAAFYDERLPPTVHDRASLAPYCAANGGAQLKMALADIASHDPGDLPALGLPSEIELAGQRLPLAYVYEPGADADGITVTVPLSLLGAIRPEQLEWLVPGWLPDKIVALLRATEGTAAGLVPLPDTARAVLAVLGSRAGSQPLAIALADGLSAARNVELSPAAFAERSLPVHLQIRIAVVDAAGVERGAGRDLRALQRTFGGQRANPPADGADWRRLSVARWDFGDLPETVIVAERPRNLALYPCLVDSAGRVDLRLEPPGAAAVALHRAGVRRLLLKALPQQAALVRDRTLADRELVLVYHGIGDSAALVDDVLSAAAEDVFELEQPIRTEAAFAACLERGRANLVAAADELRDLLRESLPTYRALKRALDAAVIAKRRRRTRRPRGADPGGLVGPRVDDDLRVAPPSTALSRDCRTALAEARTAHRSSGTRRTCAAIDRLTRWRATRPEGCVGGACDRRLSVACRGAPRVVVRATAQDRAARFGEARRAGVAQGLRGQLDLLARREARTRRAQRVEHVARHAPLAARLALVNAHEVPGNLGALPAALRCRDHDERAALEREVAVDHGLDGRPGLVDVDTFG
jgi:hypothetical protein